MTASEKTAAVNAELGTRAQLVRTEDVRFE